MREDTNTPRDCRSIDTSTLKACRGDDTITPKAYRIEDTLTPPGPVGVGGRTTTHPGTLGLRRHNVYVVVCQYWAVLNVTVREFAAFNYS